MYDDWNLVEASFAKQYGIRLRVEDNMSFSEFNSLLIGIMSDTPLGQVIAIRAEDDPKVIKSFTKEQRKVYMDWKKRRANDKLKDESTLEKELDSFKQGLMGMCGVLK